MKQLRAWALLPGSSQPHGPLLSAPDCCSRTARTEAGNSSSLARSSLSPVSLPSTAVHKSKTIATKVWLTFYPLACSSRHR